MTERLGNGLKFKKIEGAKPRPKVQKKDSVEIVPEEPLELPVVVEPKPVKLEEKPVVIEPEPVKIEEIPTPEPDVGPPKIEFLMPDKVKTGAFILVPDMPDKVARVSLNNSCLTPRIDYTIKGKSICFSFNVRKNEKITIVEAITQGAL